MCKILGKLTTHIGVQCDRVMFDQNDEIHHLELGPTRLFISAIYLEDGKSPKIRPGINDDATIAEIEAENKVEAAKPQVAVRTKENG